MMNEKAYIYPWVRKGVGSQITEEDDLAFTDGCASTLERPSIKLTAQLKSTLVGSLKENQLAETKEFPIVGPGDVLGINSNAVMKFYPPSNQENFQVDFKPYIEFWEPDFAWRYTPAKVNSQGGRLRPWLAVVACPTKTCTISKSKNGTSLVTFDINKEEDYREIFPNPTDIWKSAHAQGSDENGAEICRIICVNSEKLREWTEYTAFVIPVFETTRLRALGYEEKLSQTSAQMPSWEPSFDLQKKRVCCFCFPSFFSWNFRTGKNGETFENLVNIMKPYSTSVSGIDVDVSDLGDGLSYSIFENDPKLSVPKRKRIVMPAATQAVFNMPEKAFPSADENSDECDVYNNLRKKLELSPVFQENAREIGESSSEQQYDEDGNSDPFVVPPIYGAKHAMATKFNMKNMQWLDQVNLDLHYRSVAGLGKKVIQEHQEQLVNRAWKQVEIVKALNGEIYNRLLCSKVNDSLKNRNYRGVFKSKQEDNQHDVFLKQLMMKLGQMKSYRASSTSPSIEDVLKERNFPSTFATPTFQSRTQQLSSKIGGMDLSSLIEKVAQNDFYKIPKPYDFNYFSLRSLGFFACQVLMHSRLYADKLIDIDESKKKNGRKKIKRKFARNGMNLCPLFNHLSIHKRAPQYIRWDEIDDNYLNKSIDKVYKFQKKPSDFATNEQIRMAIEHHFNPQRLVIKSRYSFFLFYDSLAAKKSLKKMPAVFQKAPSYGSYVSNKKITPMEIGEVVGLTDFEYNRIFKFESNEKIITLIEKSATLGGDYCFVNRDKLMEQRACQSEDGLLKKFVKLGLVIKREYVDFDKAEEEIRKNVENIPDIINILTDAFEDKEFENEYVFKISTVSEWGRLYISSHSDDPAIREYSRYNTFIKKLPKLFLKNSSPTEEKIEFLNTAIQSNTRVANDRAQEVVETYFTAFLDAKSSESERKKFVNDCLNSKYPIMAYPQFPEPTYYYLKEFSDKFILPCVDELPDNSISMFKSNEAFVEAFLCGMNTEMGRELLWREFPTDQRGSYFKKFWDTETSMQDIFKDNFFDIKSLHTWTDVLGNNHCEGKSQLLMFAIKGRLMKLYPSTQIYLHKAIKKGSKVQLSDSSTEEDVIRPVAQAFFREDIYVVGFKIPFKDALGNPEGKNYGYMLVFKQVTDDLNFEMPAKECGKHDNSCEFAKDAFVKPYMKAMHIYNYAKVIKNAMLGYGRIIFGGENNNDRASLIKAISKMYPTEGRGSQTVCTTEKGQYTLINCENSTDFLNNLSVVQKNNIIFVVSAANGVMPQLREQIVVARQIGEAKIVVFMDECDIVDDTELLDLVEKEVRELFSSYGFDGDKILIIRGSTLGALNDKKQWQDKVSELMAACDEYIKLTTSDDEDEPFFMSINDVLTITGRGTVVLGRVERGVVRLNDWIECVGLGETKKYCILGMTMLQKAVEEVRAGDNVNLLLRGAEKDDFARGMVLATPKSITAHSKFKAEVYFLSKEEGGRHTPIFNNYCPQFYIHSTDITGTVQLPEGVEMVVPGSTATINVTLDAVIAMEERLRFAVREDGRIVGVGAVTEVKPEN